MLKKRFSTTLLALVVAVAIPGSVFAADVASEATGEVSTPTSVSVPADSTNEADNSGGVDAMSASTDAETNGSPDANNSSAAGADVVDSAQQEGNSGQDADAVLPKEDSEGEQTPDAVEPDPEDDGDEIAAPEVTEPEIEDGTGVVDGEEDVVAETPATEEPVAPTEITEPEAEAGDETGVIDEDQNVPSETPVVEEEPIEEMIEGETPIVEPEVIPEEEFLPVVEELVTEAAIIIEEPVAATLTITHRLIVGDQYADETQTIEGLEVGQEIDLTQYMETEDWSECISQIINITLEGTENTIILEYGVKADSGVIVVIEDSEEEADGEIR